MYVWVEVGVNAFVLYNMLLLQIKLLQDLVVVVVEDGVHHFHLFRLFVVEVVAWQSRFLTPTPK